MRRTVTVLLLLVALAGCRSGPHAAGPSEEPPPSGWPQLALLDGDRVLTGFAIVDLGHPLNARGAHWPGRDYFPFRHRTLARLDPDGVYSGAYETPEHLGTHVDAPNHFEAGQPSVDQIDPRSLFGPAAVLDVSGQARRDRDYRLTVPDVLAWEDAHGRIPRGAIVLLHTGWAARFHDQKAYSGEDAEGRLHFPAFSREAADLLVRERGASALGVDTLSVDHGPSGDYPVHHVGNAAGRWFLENLAHLERLPPRGAYLVVAPIKIEGGSGGQARVFALVPR